MGRLIAICVLAALAGCDAAPTADVGVVASADAWSRHYAHEQLQARAAGNDCRVLLIRARARLDDATVESIHYGTQPYTAYDGGVQQFAEDRQFRAVVYRDHSGEVWTYGSTTREEAASLPVCR